MTLFQTIISIVFAAVFLLFVIYSIFYPGYYSKQQAVNGEVEIVWKPVAPRSKWLIELREKDKIKVVSYPFINDVITIHEGDSLRKSKGSEKVFLRRKDTDRWVLLDKTIRVWD